MDNTGPWGCRCWLVSTQRSGSTYLAYLLNAFNGLPLDCNKAQGGRFIFGEHAHPEFCPSSDWFRVFDPIVTKMQWNLVNRWGFTRPERTRFVVLHRRDRLAHAVSLAFSNATGFFHAYSPEELSAYHARPVAFDPQLAAVCHKGIVDWYAQMAHWLKGVDVLSVDYEDVVADPLAAVRRIFAYLDTPLTTETPLEDLARIPLHKVARPEVEEYKAQLAAVLETQRANVSNAAPAASPRPIVPA